MDKVELDWFLNILIKSEGSGVGILKQRPENNVKAEWDHPIYGPVGRLYRTQGGKTIMTAVNKLQISGVVTGEIEKLLLLAGKRYILTSS